MYILQGVCTACTVWDLDLRARMDGGDSDARKTSKLRDARFIDQVHLLMRVD